MLLTLEMVGGADGASGRFRPSFESCVGDDELFIEACGPTKAQKGTSTCLESGFPPRTLLDRDQLSETGHETSDTRRECVTKTYARTSKDETVSFGNAGRNAVVMGWKTPVRAAPAPTPFLRAPTREGREGLPSR